LLVELEILCHFDNILKEGNDTPYMSKFDFNEVLSALQKGDNLTGKDGILTPLIKQLTEAVLEAELENHLDSSESASSLDLSYILFRTNKKNTTPAISLYVLYSTQAVLCTTCSTKRLAREPAVRSRCIPPTVVYFGIEPEIYQ